MAVPKRKQTPSRTGMRRSKNMKFSVKNVIEDKSNIPNTINELRLAMKKVVNKSSDNLKLKLLRAHPELGVKKNQLSSLTESSQEEQKSAGLDQCSEEEYEEIKSLNKLYKEKFKRSKFEKIYRVYRSTAICFW